MERTRRRFWTWAVTGLAVLVIVAAAASGLFQLAVQSVPGYRAEVERYVREVTGRPVRISTLELSWRYTYPSLDLHGVALLDADGATVLLEAERLRLGFSLLRLLQRNYQPTSLELQGLTLDVTINTEGRLEIAGLSALAPGGSSNDGAVDAPWRETLRPLTAFDRLRLERCRLNVRDERAGSAARRRETWSFGLSYAELARGLLGSAFEAELTLPAAVADRARLEAALQGDWLEPSTWAGDWTLELSGLTAGPWLKPYLVKGASVEFSGATLAANGELEQGRPTRVALAVQTGPVRGQRAPHHAEFQSLESSVSVEILEDGWNAKVERFVLDGGTGLWPSARAEVQARGWSGNRPGDAASYEGHLEFLRLTDLTPWLRIVEVPAGALMLNQAAGELRDTQFTFQGPPAPSRFSVRSQFTGVSLPAAGRAAGIAGLNGELAADEVGGRVVLTPGPAQVELPGMLDTATVPFDELAGEAQWRRAAEGWQVTSPQFRWKALGTRGSGQVDLQLPDDKNRSPELDLSAQFESSDVRLAKPLMPKHWGSGLKNWLDRSILSGRVPRGTLKIAGPLKDFPFIDKPGVWELDLEAAGIQLAFQPDWPPIDQLGAQLKFRGNSLLIESTQGLISGNPIQKVTARFPDFKTAELTVDGTVQGETARFFDYLANSPLRDDLAGLLSTTASGPATVEVHIDIPVHAAQNTKARGRAVLQGVELRHRSLTEPFQNIRGEVAFGGPGVRSEGLTARWYDLPIQALMTPQRDGSSQLTAELKLALDAQGRGASTLVPAWLRKTLKGESHWRASLKLGGSASGKPPPAIALTTDLVGVEISLPPPLGKPAAQAIPLVLTVGAQDHTPLRITVDYQARFGADLRFKSRAGESQLDSAALRLGGGPPIEAREPGMILGGAGGELDLRAWSEALGSMGLGGQVQSLKRVDLNLGRVSWDEYSLLDTRYQWAPKKDGWTISLVGAGGAGELRWHNPDPGKNQGALVARLDQLAVQMAEIPDAAAPAAAPPDTPAADISDPNRLPTLDLAIAKLSLNQIDFGRLQLVSERTERGQKLKTLKAGEGVLELSGSGEWRRRAGQSSAVLDFDSGSKDVAALLRALHYTPNLDAKASKAKGSLRWAPSARGIDWQQAQGTVGLEFENGQLRAVKPGVGRVLGLVNFYALPRRLTLNFKDVLGSGLGFDRIQGDFALADGNARTENLQIAGPSLRMDVRGRIGLAARDYDQQVTVYPDVSSGVTLGALALGGPVAGVLALIAQEILNKPLSQVTQLTYRVTGSWDNPQVERGTEPAVPEAAKRPPGSPSQKP